MGLRDRVLDYIAKVFMPVPDHPARGGMTGEPAPDDEADDDAAADTETESKPAEEAGPEPGPTTGRTDRMDGG